MPSLQIVDESRMTPDLDQRIRAGLCICFPRDVANFSQTRQWHGSGPLFSVVMDVSGRIIAHVGIVQRRVSFGETQANAAGVQNVFVLPEFRKQGLSDRVMIAAMQEAARRQMDCGLLFCLPALQKVYARVGWCVFEREILRCDSDGIDKPLPEKNIAMFYPLRLGTPPEGLLHLRGNDW